MRTALTVSAPLWRTMFSAVAAVALLSLAALLAGCGGGGDAAAPASPSEASAVIGPAGGTLDGPDGSRVVIPPGALAAATTITIARRDTGAPAVLPDGFAASGATYEFTPHDIVFAQPVALRIPFASNPQAAAQDVLRASPGEPWLPLQLSPANGFAEWQSVTFSWYTPTACAWTGPNPDPYPCSGVGGNTVLTATPGNALTPVWQSQGQTNYRATAAATLQLTTTFSGPPDCGDLRVDFKRRRASDAQAVVLATVQPTLTPLPSGGVRGSASFSVALSDADNGQTILIAHGSCRRAYQSPSRANLTPEQQRIGGFNAFVFDAQIAPAPRFTQQPADQSVTEPATATFSAAVEGAPAPALQWQLSNDGGLTWADIAGANGTSYTTAATTQADSGRRFRLLASNSGGQTASRSATLTVLSAVPVAPRVTQQPVDQSVAVGATATFGATLTGSPAPALQWQRSTDGGATWADIVGAQASDYTTPPVVQGDDGSRYRLVATNGAGSAQTNAAQLNVIVPLSTTPAGKLAMGRAHTCAVKADYTVACWGANNQGQLGDGSTHNASAPVAVSGLQQVVALAVGSRGFYSTHWGQSCAVQAGGGLWCWGRDVNAVDQLVPQAIAGVTDAKAVAVGSGHACYLDGTGRVRCWGFNISAELGNGTYGNPQPAPGLVQADGGGTLTGIVDVGAGDMWSCALGAGGRVWCWGVDHTGDAQLAATPISGVSGATALAVGPFHACAVVAAGGVRCWGYGGNGQLGNGGTATSTSAVAVSGLADVTALAAGTSHTCARRSGGDVVCWGSANLGNGSSSSTTPGAAVIGLGGATTVGAGEGASCALRSDGQVLCWGSNALGQLGVGDTSDRVSPTATTAGAAFWHP